MWLIFCPKELLERNDLLLYRLLLCSKPSQLLRLSSSTFDLAMLPGFNYEDIMGGNISC